MAMSLVFHLVFTHIDVPGSFRGVFFGWDCLCLVFCLVLLCSCLVACCFLFEASQVFA